MSRLQELRRFVGNTSRGIEVAPYFNPIVPKSQGYDVMIVDVFDTDRLHQNALNDPAIPKDRIHEIEPVDIVSDASALQEVIEARGLQGRFDYIVSSHNFEHLPDPIRFLRGCSTALRPGGTLTMAIPDYRACFDHFRMPTRLSDWLSAYHKGHRQPTAETLFDYDANRSDFHAVTGICGSCHIMNDSPQDFHPRTGLRKHYSNYLDRLQRPDGYLDAHCSTVFGEILELIIRDLNHLGLLDLEVLEITETRGHEFFAHLRKPEAGNQAPDDIAAFEAQRERLMRAISFNLGAAAYANRSARDKREGTLKKAERQAKAIVRRLFGTKTSAALRNWNRARKDRHLGGGTGG